LTAEHLIVVGKGKLIADTSMDAFIAGASRNVVRVRSVDNPALSALLTVPDVTVRTVDADALEVSGLTTDQIGMTAGRAGITLLELAAQQASLEEAFMDMTHDSVEFRPTTSTGAQR
jgi:ABC-2 type transport system ATP-binding protein